MESVGSADEGPVWLSFWSSQRLTDPQRETLRCYGAEFGEQAVINHRIVAAGRCPEKLSPLSRCFRFSILSTSKRPNRHPTLIEMAKATVLGRARSELLRSPRPDTFAPCPPTKS